MGDKGQPLFEGRRSMAQLNFSPSAWSAYEARLASAPRRSDKAILRACAPADGASAGGALWPPSAPLLAGPESPRVSSPLGEWAPPGGVAQQTDAPAHSHGTSGAQLQYQRLANLAEQPTAPPEVSHRSIQSAGLQRGNKYQVRLERQLAPAIVLS